MVDTPRSWQELEVASLLSTSTKLEVNLVKMGLQLEASVARNHEKEARRF
jgi:hypothetical protein